MREGDRRHSPSQAEVMDGTWTTHHDESAVFFDKKLLSFWYQEWQVYGC